MTKSSPSQLAASPRRRSQRLLASGLGVVIAAPIMVGSTVPAAFAAQPECTNPFPVLTGLDASEVSAVTGGTLAGRALGVDGEGVEAHDVEEFAEGLEEVQAQVAGPADRSEVLPADGEVVTAFADVTPGTLEVVATDVLDAELPGPSFGATAVDQERGTITYTPNENFSGNDQYGYRFVSTAGDTVEGDVLLRVTPRGVNDRATVRSGSSVRIDVLGNDRGNVSSFRFDECGVAPTVSITREAANGSVTVPRADFGDEFKSQPLYTPDPGFTGVDTFAYEGVDSSGQVFGAEVRVLVGEADAVAGVSDDEFSLVSGREQALDVLANDSEADADTLQVETMPARASVVVSGSELVVTPDGDFSGSDSLTYSVEGFDGVRRTAQVALAVSPEAVADTFGFTNEGDPVRLDVLANDNGSLEETTTEVTDGPRHGTVSINEDGSISFEPASNYYGTDSFSYRLLQDGLVSSPTTVTLTLGQPAPVDPPTEEPTPTDPPTDEPTPTDPPTEQPDPTDPPVEEPVPDLANDDTATVAAGGEVVIDVLANDDAGVLVESLEVLPHLEAEEVRVVDGKVLYRPGPTASGVDSVYYTVSDADGNTDMAEITVVVTPDANDDVLRTETNVEGRVDVLANDFGSLVRIEVVDGGEHGQAGFSDDEDDLDLYYMPDAGFSGTDVVTYRITDALGQVDTAEVRVEVARGSAPVTTRTPRPTAGVLLPADRVVVPAVDSRRSERVSSLPRTGAEVAPWAGAGVLLLGAGALMRRMGRRQS